MKIEDSRSQSLPEGWSRESSFELVWFLCHVPVVGEIIHISAFLFGAEMSFFIVSLPVSCDFLKSQLIYRGIKEKVKLSETQASGMNIFLLISLDFSHMHMCVGIFLHVHI